MSLVKVVIVALLPVFGYGCIDRTSIAGPQRAQLAKGRPGLLKPGVMVTDSTFAVGCFYLAPWLMADNNLVEQTRAQNRVAEQVFGRPCPASPSYEAFARPGRLPPPK